MAPECTSVPRCAAGHSSNNTLAACCTELTVSDVPGPTHISTGANQRRGMQDNSTESGWQPIETAPKDQVILVYGRPDDMEHVTFTRAGAHTAYWDSIDEAFCLSGAGWDGPFIKPTHWMPLPAPPATRAALKGKD